MVKIFKCSKRICPARTPLDSIKRGLASCHSKPARQSTAPGLQQERQKFQKRERSDSLPCARGRFEREFPPEYRADADRPGSARIYRAIARHRRVDGQERRHNLRNSWRPDSAAELGRIDAKRWKDLRPHPGSEGRLSCAPASPGCETSSPLSL